jgi:hypothetical protein
MTMKTRLEKLEGMLMPKREHLEINVHYRSNDDRDDDRDVLANVNVSEDGMTVIRYWHPAPADLT